MYKRNAEEREKSAGRRAFGERETSMQEQRGAAEGRRWREVDRD